MEMQVIKHQISVSLLLKQGGMLRFSGQGNDHFYGTTIQLQTWHHFALTFNGNSSRYI